MSKRCYWCGALATSDDHVPAKCFYPIEMRNNLIKVPSCEQHNTDLAKLDERFRYYIQASSQSPVAIQAFGGATVRSIMKPQAKGFRADLFKNMTPALLDGKRALAQKVDVKLMLQFFEKVTRGLYFHHLGSCFRGTVISDCSHIFNPKRNFATTINAFQSISGDLKEGQVTHPDVFKYRYGHVTEADGHGFAIMGTFYGDVTFCTIGTEETPIVKK